MEREILFKRLSFLLAATAALVAGNLTAFAQQTQILQHGLFLKGSGMMIGTADPVIERVVRGNRISPREGSKIMFPSGKVETWTSHGADSAGWFKGDYLNGGYAFFHIESSDDKVVLLEAMGNDLVYVNGVPRVGNRYGYKDTWELWEPVFNYSQIPIELGKGDNELLFVCSRKVLKVTLRDIEPSVLFNAKDLTIPDFLASETVNDWAAVNVINATDKPLSDAYIEAYSDSGISAETKLPLIQPMTLRKVRFKLVGHAPTSSGMTRIKLSLLTKVAGTTNELTRTEISVKVVPPSAAHNVTFLSDIDGSVQYYSVVPPRGPKDGKPKALFLSLHGADVIAINMANSYFPKTWGYIICPTNGGPYGFDWENWGRLDALQVLHIAKSTLNIDPGRIYLTGHSMGGHGTWIIGAQYPDQFAAIGPSAGWISWWTYVLHHDTVTSPMTKMLRRTMNPVDPYQLDQNYRQLGVYVLHGSKDDNVPVTESLNMVDTLSKFDNDFVFHEEMGVGHWWGLNDEAGTDCVDWPSMFDYFARHARPGGQRVENIDFTTANPGVSARDYWLTVYAQEKQLEPSRAIVRFIPSRNRFVGTTDNIKILSFDLGFADQSKPFDIDLDSTRLDSVSVHPGADRIWLEKNSGQWLVVSQPSQSDKGPARYGTFKDAFRNDVVFVYGTNGTEEENTWAFDKARFDAEYFWYHGNGSVNIVPDRDFNPAEYPNTNVILYGNEKTNLAWDRVLDNSQIKVSEGELVFGREVMKGKDYACFMVRPRKGSTVASVGVVAGTGITGMRLTYIVPCLQPGFELPDLTILNSEVLSKGLQNVKVAGFFGLDWSVAAGDFVVQ